MSLKNAVGGVGLLAGTAIGAAILALPVATTHVGFTYTILLYTACWFFMTLGALYLLEVNLVTGYGSNLLSMAEKTLGSVGKVFTLIVYLILLYALTAAYLSGAGAWIEKLFLHYHNPLHPVHCAVITTFLTIFVIFLGTFVTDWVNRFLMIGLLGAFAVLFFASAHYVQPTLLFSQHFTWDLRPFPLITTAFGSAIMVPTLTDYLHGKAKQLVAVVLIGSAIPLLIYIAWEMCIIGILPSEGPNGLIAIQQSGHPATDVPLALQRELGNPIITTMASYFSIFALITSLLGVTLSLFDFLADGLRIRKNLVGKLKLSAITFLPPLAFVIFYPRGFNITLSFAGLFVALLLGILPIMMVWRSRYVYRFSGPLRIIGGRIMLILGFLFFTGIVAIECFNQYERFFPAH